MVAKKQRASRGRGGEGLGIKYQCQSSSGRIPMCGVEMRAPSASTNKRPLSPHRPAPLRSFPQSFHVASVPNPSPNPDPGPSEPLPLSAPPLSLFQNMLAPSAHPRDAEPEIRPLFACDRVQLLRLPLACRARPRRCPVRSSPLYARLRRPPILVFSPPSVSPFSSSPPPLFRIFLLSSS